MARPTCCTTTGSSKQVRDSGTSSPCRKRHCWIWIRLSLTAHNWREMVRHRVQTLAWDRVVADVSPFLESSAELDLLTLENVVRVLG
jgi:hypothetical protein